VWRAFITFCTSSGQTDALRRALPSIPKNDVAIMGAAGRALQSLGDLEGAWTVLATVFPLPPAPPARNNDSPLAAKALMDLGQFDELQRLAMQPSFRGQTAIDTLKQVLLRAGASPWFRLRLAYAYADEKKWADALALLPNETAGR